MAELKTKPNDASVNNFVAAIDDPVKRSDANEILEMMREITGKSPVLWGDSIIGFGSYHYVYASGREGDWPVVGLSPRKRNLSLYIMPGFDRYEALLAKLGKHKIGKSCLYINKLADVDKTVLEQLVRESVDYMRDTYPTT